MSEAPWQIKQSTAYLSLPGVEAVVDTAKPVDGLGGLCIAGRELSGSIFRLTMPSAGQNIATDETEAHLRGNDLIVTYDSTVQWPFRTQVCWRAIDATDGLATLGGVDLIASMQTQLLDSHPELSVTTSLPVSQLLALNNAESERFEEVTLAGEQPVTLASPRGVGCLLYRFATAKGDGPAFSYAEMTHPADVGSAVLQQDPTGSLSVERRLFSSPLEKGVILRTRLRGIFLEPSGDADAALAWHRVWLESEVPMTA